MYTDSFTLLIQWPKSARHFAWLELVLPMTISRYLCNDFVQNHHSFFSFYPWYLTSQKFHTSLFFSRFLKRTTLRNFLSWLTEYGKIMQRFHYFLHFRKFKIIRKNYFIKSDVRTTKSEAVLEIRLYIRGFDVENTRQFSYIWAAADWGWSAWSCVCSWCC